MSIKTKTEYLDSKTDRDDKKKALPEVPNIPIRELYYNLQGKRAPQKPANFWSRLNLQN